jgi:2-amino-4-hydroxy-6-hydroxymethyldihydropteridine diphosphokinase
VKTVETTNPVEAVSPKRAPSNPVNLSSVQPPAVPCAIALGSNLGDSRQVLASAVQRLGDLEGITVTAQSSVYKTAPVGPPQPDYLNACVLTETRLSPQALMAHLLALEAEFGRVRQERWGPRILDLDILFYGDQVITEPDLHIPHPRLRERAFVLVPLAEIAPDWVDPVTAQSVAQLCQAINCHGVERLAISLT